MTKKSTYMNSQASCLDGMVKKGYTESFKMTNKGLFAPEQRRHYGPYEAMVITKCCFENTDERDRRSVIYVIETSDGVKGTWIDNISLTERK